MNSKPYSTGLLLLLILLSTAHLFGQDRVFLETCGYPPPPEAIGVTLCEDNSDFVPDIVIGENAASVTFASTLSNTSNWFGMDSYFSRKIEVNGRLILDEPLGFFSCTLKMGLNAEIASLGNNRLFGQASKFFACGNMWQGISGQQGGKIILYGCTIEDALYAISAEEATKLSLANNVFNRNVVGLRNTNGALGTGVLLIDYFNNNAFTSTSPLNNGIQQGYAGILLSNCVADIGAFNWPNTFEGLEYGIYAEASVVSVMSGTFRNMTFGNNGGGVGIYMRDGTLSVQGVYVPPLETIRGQSSFINCPEAGILVEGVNLYSKHNTFESNTIGILSFDNFYAETIEITQNDFKLDLPYTIGVGVIRSIASGSTVHNIISDNSFEIDQGNLGIFVTGEFPALDPMLIERNHFTVSEEFTDENLRCISVSGGNADQYLVRENEIQFNCIYGIKKSRFGIKMSNADGFDHEISFNTPISGTVDDFSARAAIYLEQAKNVTLCSNSMDWTLEGLKIEGDCDNATISSNVIGHHQYGLLIGIPNGNLGGITGIQDRKGNTWLSDYSYPEWAAYHSGTSFEVDASWFLVEALDPSILPTQRFPGENIWFRFVGGEKNYCSENAPSPMPFTTKELAVLQNASPSQLGTTVAGLWDMSRALALKGKLTPSIITSSSSTFFSEYNTASYAQAANVDYGFRSLVQLVSNAESNLGASRQNQFDALQSLMALNADREQPEQIDAVNEALLSAKLIHLHTLQAERDTESQLQQSLQQQYALALNVISAMPIMSDMTTYNADHENAYRQLQTFKTKRLLGTNTSADLAQILTLAEQDHGTHGLAVLGAQIYQPACNQANLGSVNLQSSQLLPEFTPEQLSLDITPNPAYGKTQILFNHSTSGRLLIWNLQGQIVREIVVAEQNRLELEVYNLTPGIYLIQYRSATGPIVSKKMIVE